jgi:predicted extracellular nuclease
MIRAFRAGFSATRGLALLGSAVAVVALAACGSSSSSSSTGSAAASSTQSSTATASTTSASTSGSSTSTPSSSSSSGSGSTGSGGSASVTSGPVRGVLHGENHTPTVNKLWHYSVKVTDASGHPLSGTVDVEFAFDGQVVGHDTPPTHPIKAGHWDGTLTYPAQSIGQPISLQAVVHTSAGSITLDWPIKVVK